jgi:hypothetical protein
LASDSTTTSIAASQPRASAFPYGADNTKLSGVVLAYVICVLTPIEVSLGSIALTPLRVLLLAMVVPLTVNLFSGRYGKLLACDYLFFAHMAWATLAVAVNNPDRVLENVGSAAVEFLGGYLVARAFIRTPDQFQSLIKILLFFIVLSLPFAVIETLDGRAVIPGIIDSIPGLTSVKQVQIPKRLGFYRVQNVFSHPIHYGLFCSVALTLVLVGLKDKLSLTMRILGSAAVFLGTLMSLSSGALLPLVLQIGLIGWATVFKSVKRKWLMMLGLFVMLYITIDLLSNRTPTKVFMSYATFSSQTAYYRSIIFDWGMINVWNNPVFGLGLRPWIRPFYMKQGSVDNYWLAMAMKYGIPGFILIVLGYFSALFKVGFQNLEFSERVSRLRFAWMVTFCGLSFTLTTVHVWTAMYSFVFFFFGSGLWMANYTAEDDGALPDVKAKDGEDPRPGRSLNYRRNLPPQAQRPISQGPTYSRAVIDQESGRAAEVAKNTRPSQYSRPADEGGQKLRFNRQTPKSTDDA